MVHLRSGNTWTRDILLFTFCRTSLIHFCFQCYSLLKYWSMSFCFRCINLSRKSLLLFLKNSWHCRFANPDVPFVFNPVNILNSSPYKIHTFGHLSKWSLFLEAWQLILLYYVHIQLFAISKFKIHGNMTPIH